MNEFEYDCYLKKKVASGARHRIASTRGPKGCKLSTDNMTKKEIAKMNGETVTYSMKKPVEWKEFSAWPKDLKQMYIRALKDDFKVPHEEIAKMLGISMSTYHKMLKFTNLLHLPKCSYNTFDKDKWSAFMNQGTEYKSQKNFAPPTPAHSTPAPLEPSTCKTRSTKITDMQFTAIIHNWSDLSEFLSYIDISSGVRVTIDINRDI